MLRNRKSTKWIIAINLLTGWTGFGWLGALIWAFIGKPNPNPKPRSAKQTMRLRVAAIACALATIALVIVPQLDPSIRGKNDAAKAEQQAKAAAAKAETSAKRAAEKADREAKAAAAKTEAEAKAKAEAEAKAQAEAEAKAKAEEEAKAAEAKANSPAVIDGEDAGVTAAEKAFKAKAFTVTQSLDPILGQLEKKYGEDGAADYVEAFWEAADAELLHLIVETIGPRPTDKSDDYYGALGIALRAVERMVHDEASIKYDYREPFYFSLTKYNKDYAWGATLNFSNKNVFGGTVKNFVNVYLANGRVLNVATEDEDIASKNLRLALEDQFNEQAKPKSKSKKR